jgi:oxygen-independent coproporphyrinogen-3 oxidase
MLNALRLAEGVPNRVFEERTGLALSEVSADLQSAVARGLLDADPTVIRPTAMGLRFLNDLQQMFLP